MKLRLVVLGCFISYMSVVNGAPRPENLEDDELDEIVKSCAAELELSAAEAWTSLIMPVDSPGNCVVACVWDKVGLVDSNGKILPEKMVESIRETLQEYLSNSDSDEKKREFLSKGRHVYQCIEEANIFGEKCRIVSEYFKCMIRDFFDF